MELQMKLIGDKANIVREAIKRELEYPSEDCWDGEATVYPDGTLAYTTGTHLGSYALWPDNTLIFTGRRNSFLSGCMLFGIQEEDVLEWTITETQQPQRSPWDTGTLNLTQHERTEDQFRAGVVEPIGIKEKIQELLTFEGLPTAAEIEKRATELAVLAHYQGYQKAMIGGAPYLMPSLERALQKQGITPVYAFSERVSEEKEVDGKVIKTQVFKHLGFVEVNE